MTRGVPINGAPFLVKSRLLAVFAKKLSCINWWLYYNKTWIPELRELLCSGAIRRYNLTLQKEKVTILNYTEAVEYIYNIPKFTTKNKPEHTVEFLNRLGHPERSMKIIHVAGTNGKGSVCAFLSTMLTEAADSPLYIPPSGEDQRAVPDQQRDGFR